MYTSYITYFPEAFLQVKKLMEKTYSETEQNMSEKQGKGFLWKYNLEIKIHYTQAKIYREVVTTCF
jgi:hypothetical protein